jgi:hypothetical protein
MNDHTDIPDRPEYCSDDMLVFLDKLRNSGETNMFGAAPNLEEAYGLTRAEAKATLLYWMGTYSDRHTHLEQ